MIYADEAFYVDKYLLGKKPVISTGFSFYARSASQMIDRYTFNRLELHTVIPEAVSMCCCELAEEEYSNEKLRKLSGGKTSEKVGTWSASYAEAGATDAAGVKRSKSIIYKWLGDTGLCYKGVD